MMYRNARISKVAIVGGIVILVLLLAVAQLSLADQGPETTTHFSIVPVNAAETTTCTTGPTGGCSVTYYQYAGNDPQTDCGASECKVRVETRW